MHPVSALTDALGVAPSARLRVMHQQPGGQASHRIVRASDVVEHVERLVEGGYNVWVSTSVFGPGHTGKIDDVVGVSAISLDMDYKEEGVRDLGGAQRLGTAVADLLGVQPAVLIATGHGMQAHWAVDDVDASWEIDDAATRARWMDLYRRWGMLAQHLAGEMGMAVDTTFSLERVWRCPGTTNGKPGVEPVPSTVLWRSGEYDSVDYDAIDDAIRSVMGDLPDVAVQPLEIESVGDYDSYPPVVRARLNAWTQSMVDGVAASLRSLATDARDGWDNNAVRAAFRLVELAESPWCPLTHDYARSVLVDNMPTDAGFDTARVLKKFDSALKRRNAGSGAKPPEWLGAAIVEAAVEPQESASKTVVARDELDVGNTATMARWLQGNLGRGHLAGVFSRGGELAYTPLLGQEGYVALSDQRSDSDGPAQVRQMTGQVLAARVQYTYDCFTWKEDKDDDGKKEWKQVPSMFPRDAAITASYAPDMMTHLRPLRGVTHSPTVRPDGTILQTPGYDEETGLLYLPTPGRVVPELPDEPSADDVKKALGLVSYMLQDFKFVTDSDRLNYIGLMLTPLLRPMAPAPYKLALIEAHQPGSGKTYLARALSSIHGGVFRSEIPREDAELGKQITSILDVTTGAVVVFDNVTGVVKSPTLAGLLTTGKWEDRRLGSNKVVSATNDRLWVMTGNNMAVSGDLARRTLRVQIDPGVPDPHLRKNFAITDFENWVIHNRGDLLWSLLVLIRSWVVAGMPSTSRGGGDSYARWQGIIADIAAHHRIAGTFGDEAEQAQGDEDAEWAELLEAIYAVFADREWTARDILDSVDEGPLAGNNDIASTKPIHYDALPSDLIAKRKYGDSLVKLSKSFGRWLANRKGRWAGEMSVQHSSTRKGVTYWRIVKHGA